MCSHVDSTGLKAHYQSLGIVDDLKGYLVEIRLFSPVFTELLKSDAFLYLSFCELERTGSNNFLFGIDVLGNDGGGNVSKELCIRCFQFYDNFLVAYCFN